MGRRRSNHGLGSRSSVFVSTRDDWIDVLLDIFRLLSNVSVHHPSVVACAGARMPKIEIYVVFASPLRLDLELLCNSKTPVETLGVWPLLPMTIYEPRRRLLLGGANVVTALKHHDRVGKIFLSYTTGTLLEEAISNLDRYSP